MHKKTIPASKLPDVGTTIFTVMSALADQHQALNLSQGFPDFATPVDLLDSVSAHMSAGHNQYAPMAGVPALREAIGRKTMGCYNRQVNPDTEVTVTSGATSALFNAIQAFIHPGDEVIVFDPAYDSYDPAIRLAGGNVIHMPLLPPAFNIDWSRVQAAVTASTAMIIINSPHNPTGSVISAADIEALKELVRDTRIILLSDEVYEHIIFDNQRHESLLFDDELFERSLVVSSFGKTFHMTGWKIGYCVAPEALMQEFRRIHQFTQFCVVTPMQWALAEFLDNHAEHYLQLGRFYEKKRDNFIALMAKSRFKLTPSAGSYFQLADYSAISDMPDTEFTRWMTIEKGVAAIPVSVFYESPPEQQIIRFCFAKNSATLKEAAEILCAI